MNQLSWSQETWLCVSDLSSLLKQREMTKRKISISTPARKLFSIFLCILAVSCCGSWLIGSASHLDLRSTSISQIELDGQLRSVRRRLNSGEPVLQMMIVPEAGMFVYSFYGYTLINMSMDRPHDEVFKAQAREELERLIATIADLSQKPPFNINDKIKPKGGIIIAGHSNLLRAGYVLLGGKDPKLIQDFHDRSQEIAASFLSNVAPFPECYPGYTWAQDAIFALESLRLHDVLYKTDYSKSRKAWLDWLKTHLDKETGMMVAQVDPHSGAIQDVPRGCAISWALGFLPNIDPEFSKSQFARFRKDWFVPFAGMLGITEWYHGKPMPTQFPTGPVAFGLGAAATGIGIGACRANNDFFSWHLILRALNVLGFPQWTPVGEKTYFYQQCLLADVLALWGETVRPWDREPNRKQEWPPIDGHEFFYVVLGAGFLVCKTIFGILMKRTINLFRDKSLIQVKWQRATIVAFILQCLAVVTFILSPVFSWLQLIIYMACVDLLEEMTLRPRIVAKIFDEEDKAEKTSR